MQLNKKAPTVNQKRRQTVGALNVGDKIMAIELYLLNVQLHYDT